MRKFSVVILIFMMIFGFYFYIEGYRFTPEAAAKANGFVTNDDELIGEYKDDSIFYLYKNDEKQEYRTVHVRKNQYTYHSYASTFIGYSQDPLQTIGGMSVRYDDEKATIFVLLSKDPAIDSIVVHTEFGDEKKKIMKDQPIYFQFPYAQQIDQIKATAYDKNGNALYTYGGESESIKWHEI
ncbi:hypothetical protein [Ureibacillus endophyticus]|uniref:Uncharacterized protein n=1 Tax=Ureibacillus endophyticus TaxID=1978490 RepID=A0A494Z741_9BACL|nr:hypothetical protein [Lysinibacillus endophyticus]RKQ18384.1 hypothetical protein D8M03_05910 [Lysinibacillus endophyticus]